MDKQELEHTLAGMANRKFCLLVSRGATALYLAYEALIKLKTAEEGIRRIVLPATMCHSPANVALYAHLEPVFCDVTGTDYTLDPHCLENILRTVPGIVAVVSAGIFGHSPDMEKIAAACKAHHVFLVDDAAQTLGGHSAGIPAAGWGEIGIYSFGHTKTVDVGWGGAILTDNEAAYTECRKAYEKLEGPSEKINELRAVYSETYYTIERLTAASPVLSPLFWPFPGIFRDLYIYRLDSETKAAEISKSLESLEDNISLRKQYWNTYREIIQPHSSLLFPVLREGSTPWRFTFRITGGKRNAIVQELRSRNIDVSTWYPSLKNRFRSSSVQNNSCPVAELITNELVNLWVDPQKTDPGKIEITARLINELINK
jgi:dTDP-4-amino-4,6-dideoxygalactose transaminase